MSTNCQEIQRVVWSREEWPAYVRMHVDTCADCRVEVRRTELLAASLSDLAGRVAEPPSRLAEALVAVAAPSARPFQRAADLYRNPVLRRGAAVTAALGGAAAAAAVGLVLARRVPRPDPVG